MQQLDPAHKLNAKRCVMTLLPTVPGPVVDYALSTPFFASALGPATQPQPEQQDQDNPPFLCRKMDSGRFGELSIISPIGGRYMTIAEAFADGSKLTFEMSQPVNSSGRGRR